MNKLSTNFVEMLKFGHHGTVELTIYENGILLYLAEGPFNKEIVDAVAEMEAATLEKYKLEFGIWCEIVEFKKTCLIMEDAFSAMAEYLKESKEQGLAQAASAYVFTPEIEGRHLMEKRYEECYRQAGITFKSFDNRGDALDWTRAQVSKLSSTKPLLRD